MNMAQIHNQCEIDHALGMRTILAAAINELDAVAISCLWPVIWISCNTIHALYASICPTSTHVSLDMVDNKNHNAHGQWLRSTAIWRRNLQSPQGDGAVECHHIRRV